MKIEVEGRLISSKVVAVDDGGDEDTPTATSSGSYWVNTKESNRDILQNGVVCVKSKQGSEGSREKYVHHKNATTKLSQTFGAAKQFFPRNSEGDSESKS